MASLVSHFGAPALASAIGLRCDKHTATALARLCHIEIQITQQNDVMDEHMNVN